MTRGDDCARQLRSQFTYAFSSLSTLIVLLSEIGNVQLHRQRQQNTCAVHRTQAPYHNLMPKADLSQNLMHC
jgi:hypothetical protein